MSKKFGIYVPDETAEKLEKFAAEDNATRSEIVRRAINVYIKQRENPNWIFVPAIKD
jgi:metal-responsive CopG/Arc/MetJ family transcriptional regulator